jgi:cell division protein FtsW
MRSKRFLAFLEPLAHRQATGYQLFNGKLAIASGGFFGQGLGASRQKLGFIPESHTDFVLAIIGEELGLFAIALVAIGFIFVLLRGLRIAQNAPCEFSRLLAAGITLFLGTQAAINFGVVMGLLPTKGLTLPFVSYGGSSLVVVALALGILLGVGRRSAPAAAAGTRQTAAGAATPAGPAEERG